MSEWVTTESFPTDAHTALRISWLRAVEWGKWPVFLFQPILPILLVVMPFWAAVLPIVLLAILWIPIRYRFVSLTLANIGCYFVRLKWLAIPISVYLLIVHHRYLMAVVSLTIPLWISIVGMVSGTTQIGILQKGFMRQFGWYRRDHFPPELEGMIRYTVEINTV